MTFTIKVKTAYKKDQWEVSIDDPSMKEKGPEIGDVIRTLHRRLITHLQQEIVTPNRIIVTLGTIKASGSEEIDEDTLHHGGTVLFDIEDMRISTSFLVNFSKDRTLDSFQQQETPTNLVLPDEGQVTLETLQKIADKVAEVAERTGETPSEVLDRARAELDGEKVGAE
ncbi:MAG: hypothetical protein M0Q91_13310 [Methanoregula sp.]|jgi:hypothetical protein|nr:hypothetical protein [Methanoregula sp.]